MSTIALSSSLATLLATTLGFRPSVTQSPQTIAAHPGNDIVNGLRVAPSLRRFTIASLACEQDSPSTPREIGSLVEEIRLARDSILLRVRHQTEPDGASFVDTTAYHRRTLAPLWDRTYSRDWRTSWDFIGSRVTWSNQQSSQERETLDSSLDEQRFLAGMDELLIPATARLFSGDHVTYLLLDLAQGPGEPPAFGLYTTMARVTGSEQVAISRDRRIDAWILTADEAFGRYTYWIDKRSHNVVMWQTPEYESLCPMKYISSSP